MSEVQHVHFRVGADTGILLLQIAHEHLLYSNDLDKAMKMFTESLGGEVPEDMALKLLSGEMLVLVDEEAQMFDVVERKNHPELEDIYPKQIDFNKFVADKQKELDDHCENLDKSLDIILNKFRYRDTYRLDIPVESLMKYIYGKDDEFIAEIKDSLEYDDEIQQMKSLIRVTKDFIEKSISLSKMIKRLKTMYDIKNDFDAYDLMNLVQKVQDIAKANFTTFTEGDDEMLNSYMEASKEIDTVVKQGIEPVDIMDNYSAGWLSPEGDYYALNGEIANMLHIQIGSALQEQGLIPEKDKHGTVEQNPDAWLEQHGWVKIHTNNIQFAGCLNSKIDEDLPNIHMTDTQKKLIYEYIQICHGGVVRAGWKMEKISASRFQMTDDLMLAKNYFSYD